MSLAKAIIIGRLGRDPELRFTAQGKPVCSFSMATDEKRGQDKITTWFKITLWGKQAETASQYLRRGSPVCIEGRISLEEWTDREGKTRSSIAINGTDMTFIDSKGSGEQRSESSAKTVEVPELSDDDIPF